MSLRIIWVTTAIDSLRACQELGEVVARHVLDNFSSGVHPFTGRKDNVQSIYIVFGRSVFDRSTSSRSLSHVSSDAATVETRRIRGIKEAFCFYGFLQLAGDDSRVP